MVALVAALALAAPSCTAGDGRAVVREFAGAWNRGDVAAAVRLWASEPEFQWLSSAERSGRRAYDRATLPSYIRSRVRAHERLRILRLGAGYDPARGIVNVAGKLARGGRAHDFKAAVVCGRGSPRLIVWSM